MTPDIYESCAAAERAWTLSGGDRVAAEAILFCWNKQVQETGKSWAEVVGLEADPKSPNFQYILQIVDFVYINMRKDRLVNGANRFGKASDIPEGVTPTASIGQLFFWRED
jgi:hypothetical protein